MLNLEILFGKVARKLHKVQVDEAHIARTDEQRSKPHQDNMKTSLLARHTMDEVQSFKN